MDPYLEAYWLDVHGSLVIDSKNALNRVLPDDLAAYSEERVAVESPSDADRETHYNPDIRVVDMSGGSVAVAEPPSAISAGVPIRLLADLEPATKRFIRIVEPSTERVITIIEFISPSNKRKPDLSEFRAKRGRFLADGVSFVEIDLVRAGNWRALLRPHVCPPTSITPYRVTMRFPRDPAAVWLVPISLRQRLPSLIVPLRAADPEIKLDLQELVEQIYESSRYGRRINYSRPLDPPLDPADQQWAATLGPS